MPPNENEDLSIGTNSNVIDSVVVDNSVDTTAITTMSTTTLSDDELIRQGEEYYNIERYIAACRCFDMVNDKTKLLQFHLNIIEMTNVAKTTIRQLILPNPIELGWKKQAQMDGLYNTMIYYRIQHPENIIICRLETPIEFDLLCPLISVLNESSLYYTWMPHWNVPKLRLSESNLLKEMGRGHQLIQIRIDTPYPFANRECYLHPYTIDCIDEDEYMNSIFVKINSYNQEGTYYDLFDIPKVPNGYRRADMDAGLLIRPCPKDHPSYSKSTNKKNNNTNNKIDTNTDPKLLLVTMMLQANGHVANVPLSIINFITRHVIGSQWSTLLQIAYDVQIGKRIEHQKAIQEKPELYNWVENRVKIMLDKI